MLQKVPLFLTEHLLTTHLNYHVQPLKMCLYVTFCFFIYPFLQFYIRLKMLKLDLQPSPTNTGRIINTHHIIVMMSAGILTNVFRPLSSKTKSI